MRLTYLIGIGILVGILNFVPEAKAHKGLPIPVISNKAIAFGNLSVSADPELGEGIFLLTLDSNSDIKSDDIAVSLSAYSASDRTETVKAVRDPSLEQRGKRTGFRAAVPFTHHGNWTVEIVMNDNIQNEKINLPIEVTLPGPSKKEFLLFLIPFIFAFGLLFKPLFRLSVKQKRE